MKGAALMRLEKRCCAEEAKERCAGEGFWAWLSWWLDGAGGGGGSTGGDGGDPVEVVVKVPNYPPMAPVDPLTAGAPVDVPAPGALPIDAGQLGGGGATARDRQQFRSHSSRRHPTQSRR